MSNEISVVKYYIWRLSMQTTSDQVYTEKDSKQSADEVTVKVKESHLESTFFDMESIMSNNRETISQLTGNYQVNSDGTFKSYSTEDESADGVNKVKIHIDAEYSSGDINGYAIKYTAYDLAGNILGSISSKLDADGTDIDCDNVESQMTYGVAASSLTTEGPESLLVEAINGFLTQESAPVSQGMGISGATPKMLMAIVPDSLNTAAIHVL